MRRNMTIARGVMGALLIAAEGSQAVQRVSFTENNGGVLLGVVTCVDCAPVLGNCEFTSNSAVMSCTKPPARINPATPTVIAISVAAERAFWRKMLRKASSS